MRPYCALYVDAGYLLASAAARVAGTSLRGSVVVEHQELIRALMAQAEQDSGLPLLRANWYDSAAGVGGSPDRIQQAIGEMNRVKLRLGRLSPHGEQKGVDLKLGLDLVTHSRNRVADVSYLVSGDDDLTEAVEEAQSHGVQVFAMAVPDREGRPHSMSRNLWREVDGVLLIDGSTMDRTVRIKSKPVAAETCADAAAAGSPVPTPNLLAGRRPEPSPAVLASRDAARARQESHDRVAAVVATSASGAATVFPADDQLDSTIDQVCRSVTTAWLSTATETDRRHLKTSRPYILPDIDRALLTDLSMALGEYDIGEDIRVRLRNRFWDTAETLPALA